MTWYSRPVFFVADLDRSAAFYVNTIGFVESWRHVEGGVALVAQVDRDGCELLISSQWPAKAGGGMLFISIDQTDYPNLRADLVAKGAPVRDGWWGYRTLIVTDPDGNELYFSRSRRQRRGYVDHRRVIAALAA